MIGVDLLSNLQQMQAAERTLLTLEPLLSLIYKLCKRVPQQQQVLGKPLKQSM
jgi:hypothetical protein